MQISNSYDPPLPYPFTQLLLPIVIPLIYRNAMTWPCFATAAAVSDTDRCQTVKDQESSQGRQDQEERQAPWMIGWHGVTGQPEDL